MLSKAFSILCSDGNFVQRSGTGRGPYKNYLDERGDIVNIFLFLSSGSHFFFFLNVANSV